MPGIIAPLQAAGFFDFGLILALRRSPDPRPGLRVLGLGLGPGSAQARSKKGQPERAQREGPAQRCRSELVLTGLRAVKIKRNSQRDQLACAFDHGPPVLQAFLKERT